jgi:DNA repair protein RecO (recombination protein O)
MRIELQPAYVLHSRPYRDTSLLVDFFTPAYGRIAAVARGVRQRKTRTRSLLNPFTRLLISLQGKTDLKLLAAVEADNHFVNLQGQQLYSGFYLNELLMRLLPEMDAHENLFESYQVSLNELQDARAVEPVLRHFELTVLEDLGYGIDFERDAETGEVIQAQAHYRFELQKGFTRASSEESYPGRELILPGAVIAGIAQRDFSENATRLFAKQLCRQMLKPLLGNRSLNSRALFVTPNPEFKS